RVNEEQEVQTALLVNLEAILYRVGNVDDSPDQVPRAARLEIFPQIRAIQRNVRWCEAVGGRMADRAQVVAPCGDQSAARIDDFRLGMRLAEEVVEHILVALRHVFELQAELLRVTDHRLVPVVDEFAAALDHLAREIDGPWKRAAEREAPAAGPIARLVN